MLLFLYEFAAGMRIDNGARLLGLAQVSVDSENNFTF